MDIKYFEFLQRSNYHVGIDPAKPGTSKAGIVILKVGSGPPGDCITIMINKTPFWFKPYAKQQTPQ